MRVSMMCGPFSPVVATCLFAFASLAWPGVALPATEIIPSAVGAAPANNDIASRRLGLIAPSSLSRYPFDVRQLPGLVGKSLFGTIQTEQDFELPAGVRRYPVGLLASRRLR